MAGRPRTPPLLLATLALALALALAAAVSPGAGRRGGRPGAVGGAMDADVQEEGVQRALAFAVGEYNRASNDAYHSRAVRVLRARKQVTEFWSLASTFYPPASPPARLPETFWSLSVNKLQEGSGYSCWASPQKVAVVFQGTCFDNNECCYEGPPKQEGNYVCVKLADVNKSCSLHVQVVSGMNYFLEVEIGRTTCTKSQPNLDNCPFHDQPHLMRVYTVPWLGKTSLVKSSCQDV